MVDFQRLASLATRPPTPPQKSIQKATSLHHENEQLLSTAHDILLDTPEESPRSSAEYFTGSSEKLPKRVGFSPWTKCHKPLGNGSQTSGWTVQVRALPPSRDCKSSKSILKPSIEPVYPASMGDLPSLDQSCSLSAMLDSALRHLASTSRNSRIDAYTALLGCLSAYDEIPEVHALAENLPTLTKFFHRDMVSVNEETGSLDTHLVAQAVKLLTFFLATPGISELLPDDFCSFVIEQSIVSLEDQRIPKIVINHYMLLLAKQRFSPKHTTSDRMNRLITALHNVANTVKGNRVVGQRLMIYRRLLTQAKFLMITRVGDWIDHLITGMLSTIKDIRSWALYFGLEASFSLGTTRLVSQACVDMFNRESQDGKKVVHCLSSRLTEMTSSKDDGVHVPQIWAIVILFLRSRRNQLESWEHFKMWLMIIQKCFNSSDSQMKFQANIAWNRLIFAVNLNPLTSSAMIKMLRQPIASQLDRKSSQKAAKPAKRMARSSYCTLLYYAFRPATTYAQLDQYWEEYITQMFPCDRAINTPDVDHYCEILAALLSSSQPKVWDENRINISDPVKPDELLPIDPKWVRSRSADILKVFENMLSVADWQPRKDTEAPIVLAWRSLTTALGEASNKEVKVSMETMTAVAHLVNTIKRFWYQGQNQKNTSKERELSHVIDQFELLIHEAIVKIGTIPFTEKRLMQSSQDSFEVAETPSSRSIRPQGPLSSPASSLLSLLVSNIGDDGIPDNYTGAIEKLVELALRSATSRRTQLAVLRDLLYSVPPNESNLSKGKIMLWQLIAKAASLALRSVRVTEKHGDSPQNVGHEYRDAAKILEFGLLQDAKEAVLEWQELGTNLAHNLNQEIGSEAVTLIIIEPLAAALLNQLILSGCSPFSLASACFLLKNAKWPSSRQAMERARKELWGVGPVSQKQANLDPFDHLYSMANTLLNNAYSQLNRDTLDGTLVEPLLLEVTSFLDSCPVLLKGVLLKQIQQGLATWIEDADGALHNYGSAHESTSIYRAVIKLWETTNIAIKASPRIDSPLLSNIEPLIAASLRSRQKMILNESIQTWNQTFGIVDCLEYPEALRPILLNLRACKNILLPNFPEGMDSDLDLSLSKSAETQTDEERTPRSKTSPSSDLSIGKAGTSRSSKPTVELAEGNDLLGPCPGKPSPKTTPKTRARPRHDDSQMHFAVIESSPLVPEAVDSQLLTNHQKEVRERQQFEAGVMFPDLRTTPKIRVREQGDISPKLILRGTQVSRPESNAVDSCAVLPAADDISDDFFESSPTPRSSIRRNSGNRPWSSRDPSPTPVKEHTDIQSSRGDSIISIGKPANCEAEAEGRMLIGDNDSASELQDMKIASRANVLGDLGDSDESSYLQPIEFGPDEMGLTSPNQDQDMLDGDPSLDLDVFIDAPSELLQSAERDMHELHAEVPSSLIQAHEEPEPSDHLVSESIIQEPVTPYPQGNLSKGEPNNWTTPEENEINRIMDSFQGSETSHILSDEDQIVAQLASDLSRASSEAEAEISGSSSPIRQEAASSSRKRKGSAENTGRYTKKLRALPQLQAIQVVVPAKRAGSTESGRTPVDERKLRRAHKEKQEPSPLAPRFTRSSARISAKKSTARKNPNRSTGKNPSRSTSVTDVSLAASEETGILPTKKKSGIKSGHRKESDPNCDRAIDNDISQVQLQPVEMGQAQTSQSQSHNIRKPALEQGSEDLGEVAPSPKATDIRPIADKTLAAIDRAGSEDLQYVQPEAMEQAGRPRAQEILTGFRRLLGNIKQMVLGVEEEREMIGVLFESVSEVHAAGRRSTGG